MHKYSLRQKIVSLWNINKDDSPCKAIIKFDDLWNHLVSEAQKETKCELIFSSITLDFSQGASANFKVEFDNPIQGLRLWIVAEVCYLDCWHILSSSQVIGPQLQLERPGCTNQSHNGELEQLQTHFESSRLCKRCWWNDHGVRKAFKRGKTLLTNTCARYLTRSSWIL